MMNNIYPCKYVPDVNENAKSFIAMGFQYEPNPASKMHYTTSLVTFYIFCHKNLIETDYGSIRYDYALERVDQIINGSRSREWIGKMEFYGAEDTVMDVKGEYVGITATYRSVDFA